jgi:5'/3'-nucleotidase SurE
MRCTLLFVLLLSPILVNAAGECDKQAALNILLTNDDGYDTDGIVALHRALKSAGHNVKRIAPERNYSGSSASLTLEVLTATQVSNEEFAEVYAVAGSPATTVLVGATAMFGPDEVVDLVVSGINDGANLGPATPISGTVGATIAAMKVLVPPVPAIAVSTNAVSEEEGSAENLAHVANIANFTTRLIAALQCGDQPWSTGALALNVNYPPLMPKAIKGVRVAAQGEAAYFSIGFKALGDDRYAPDFGPAAPGPDSADSDTALFGEGYITIVPIDGNYTAYTSEGTQLPSTVESVAP